MPAVAGDEQSPGQRSLRRVVHQVRSVAFGERTTFEAGRLTVSTREAEGLFDSGSLAQVRLTWASPGDRVRLVKILDTVEPRTKGPGGSGVFPGFLGPARAQGVGQTHVLRGAAVVAAGFLPRAQEAVADLAGTTADLTPLGRSHNLVVEFEPAEGAGWEAVASALRRGQMALAAHLAEAALGATPDSVEDWPPPGTRPNGGLPRVGAITNLQTQGLFKETFVYGQGMSGSFPTFITPGELDDGAVVSGQFGHPALKNCTYLYQNHPVAEELRRRHGTDLHLGGLVVSPEPVDQEHKELVAAHAARMCAVAGLDAVVLTKEGGGNADADVSLKMDQLEDLGIAAVGLFAEMAGPDGTGPSIVVPPNRATAMVSTGNYDEARSLPGVERTLGGDRVDIVDTPADAELELPTAAIYCALSPLGWGRLTCRESAAA